MILNKFTDCLCNNLGENKHTILITKDCKKYFYTLSKEILMYSYKVHE